jgi:hypothetical protein
MGRVENGFLHTLVKVRVSNCEQKNLKTREATRKVQENFEGVK